MASNILISLNKNKIPQTRKNFFRSGGLSGADSGTDCATQIAVARRKTPSSRFYVSFGMGFVRPGPCGSRFLADATKLDTGAWLAMLDRGAIAGLAGVCC